MTLQPPASARILLAAAAVLLVVILCASCASPSASVGDSGSPTPSPTAAPTATGPTSLMDSPEAGDLPAGAYYLDLPAYPARIDFEVPAGWWHFWGGATRLDSDAHAILVNSEDTGAANGSAWGVAFTVVEEVRVDPCDPAAGNMDSSVTESAEALAEAFSSWEDFPATGVEDTTLGGFSGMSVEIAVRRQPAASRRSSTRPWDMSSGRSFPAPSRWSTSSCSSTSRARSW